MVVDGVTSWLDRRDRSMDWMVLTIVISRDERLETNNGLEDRWN